MKLRIAGPALLAIMGAVGGGCDPRGDISTLIVHNYGIGTAEVTYWYTFATTDSDTDETSSAARTEDLPPGRTLTREFQALKALHLDVIRKDSRLPLLQETFHSGDFGGKDSELEIVVRP